MDTHWPLLNKDDAGLMEEINQLLTAHATGDPYSDDGTFAATVGRLPAGLRAMTATHLLDISLTLDSITWHFGNFGEPGLVALTEAGLRELALSELADCFVEARELMQPLLANRTEADGDPYEINCVPVKAPCADTLPGRIKELLASINSATAITVRIVFV